MNELTSAAMIKTAARHMTEGEMERKWVIVNAGLWNGQWTGLLPGLWTESWTQTLTHTQYCALPRVPAVRSCEVSLACQVASWKPGLKWLKKLKPG